EIAAFELVEKMAHQPRSRGTDWVPDGDRTSIRIDKLGVSTRDLDPCKWHRGKRLVDFEKIHVCQRESGLLQNRVTCRNGTLEHQYRVNANHRLSDDPRSGRDASFGRSVRGHEQHGGGTVRDLAGVACGDPVCRIEGWLELGTRLITPGRPHGLVA